MGPLLAGMAGMAGAKMLGSALGDDDAAKKQALAQLHQQYAGGSYGAAPAPAPESNLAADLGQGALNVGFGALTSDDKKDVPWWKSAARGALGKV